MSFKGENVSLTRRFPLYVTRLYLLKYNGITLCWTYSWPEILLHKEDHRVSKGFIGDLCGSQKIIFVSFIYRNLTYWLLEARCRRYSWPEVLLYKEDHTVSKGFIGDLCGGQKFIFVTFIYRNLTYWILKARCRRPEVLLQCSHFYVSSKDPPCLLFRIRYPLKKISSLDTIEYPLFVFRRSSFLGGQQSTLYLAL